MSDSAKDYLVKLASGPLGIFALLVTLVETVVIFGVVNTSGNIQGWLTAFVLIFPSLLALGIFLILWIKPQTLYPPSEYGGNPKVGEYTDAMQGRTREIAVESGPENSEDTADSKIHSSMEREEKEALEIEIPPKAETAAEEEPSAIVKGFDSIKEGNFEEAYNFFCEEALQMPELNDQVARKGFFLYFLFGEGWSDSMNKIMELKEAHSEIIILSFYLGFMYRKTHKWNEAIECYQNWKNGAKTENDIVDRSCSLAWVYFEAGQKAECLNELKGSFGTTSDPILLSKLYKDLGDLLLEIRKDQPHLGLACFEKALELKPTDSGLRFDIAYNHSKILSPSLTFYHYRKAISVDPNNESANNNAGVAADLLELPLTSVGFYKEAEKLKNTLSMSNMASKLIDAGFADEAKLILERARQQENYHENIDINFGRIPKDKRNEEKRIKELELKLEKLISWRAQEAEAIAQPSFSHDQLVGTYQTTSDWDFDLKVGDQGEIIGEYKNLIETFKMTGNVEGTLVYYQWNSTPIGEPTLGGLLALGRPTGAAALPARFGVPASGEGTFIIKDEGKTLTGYRTEKDPLNLREWTFKRKI